MFKAFKQLKGLKRHLKETLHVLSSVNIFKYKHIDYLEKRKWGKRFYYNKERIRFIMTGKVSIPFFSYFVTSRCTLNCKSCNAYIPSYTKETHLPPVTFEVFKEDLDKLLKSVDKIHIFQFVGGEPLLAKDLPKMIEYAKTKKQLETIFVTTNTTLMPSDELLKSFKGIYVQLSDYRHIKGIKLYYDEIKNLLKKHKIKYCIPQEENDNDFDSLPELYEKNEDDKTIEDRSVYCFYRYCNELHDGKLYLCPAVIHMERNLKLNTYNNIVDIRNCTSKELTQKLIDFYSLPFYRVCGNCHFENVHRNQTRGEQTIIHTSQTPEIAGEGCLNS